MKRLSLFLLILLIFPQTAIAREAARALPQSREGLPFPAVLLDTKVSLQKAFGTSPNALTLLTIDRAGFLRRREVVFNKEVISNPALLSKAVQNAIAALPKTIEEGKPAFDFTIRDMNGQTRRLSGYRGRKNLLLTFFPRCFTGGCVSHLASLQKERLSLREQDTEIIAVSVDAAEGPRGQRAFAKSLGLEFPLIPDTGRNLSILYGAANSPEQVASRISVLIDKQGVVRWIDKQINVRTHGADVLLKLHEFGMT